jgi:hypothetical protein
MIPDPNEETQELKEMKRLATAAVFEFVSIRNGLGKAGCFCRASDLSEILNMSTNEGVTPGTGDGHP